MRTERLRNPPAPLWRTWRSLRCLYPRARTQTHVGPGRASCLGLAGSWNYSGIEALVREYHRLLWRRQVPNDLVCLRIRVPGQESSPRRARRAGPWLYGPLAPRSPPRPGKEEADRRISQGPLKSADDGEWLPSEFHMSRSVLPNKWAFSSLAWIESLFCKLILMHRQFRYSFLNLYSLTYYDCLNWGLLDWPWRSHKGWSLVFYIAMQV